MKKKYAIYAIYSASKYVGTFEAETEAEAIEKAEAEANVHVNICHQCAHEIDIGDYYEFQANEE